RTVDGSRLIPVTEFRRDAYGNVLVKIDYDNGLQAVDESGNLAFGLQDSPTGRYTYTRYDAHGNAVQNTDAVGNSHYASYDASGRLAKEWQAVTGNDGHTQTSYKVYQYDKVGNTVDVIEPGAPDAIIGGLNASFESAQPDPEYGLQELF